MRIGFDDGGMDEEWVYGEPGTGNKIHIFALLEDSHNLYIEDLLAKTGATCFY